MAACGALIVTKRIAWLTTTAQAPVVKESTAASKGAANDRTAMAFRLSQTPRTLRQPPQEEARATTGPVSDRTPATAVCMLLPI